jgi:hypothetical protein
VHEVREAGLDEIGRGTLGTGFFRMQVDTTGATDEAPPAARCTDAARTGQPRPVDP